MAKAILPLQGKTIITHTPYLVFYNEIFIGFGKNVNANIFDQNRAGILLGYKFSKLLKTELGIFNQTLQFGRLINGRNVFQYNTGLMLSTIFTFEAKKQKK